MASSTVSLSTVLFLPTFLLLSSSVLHPKRLFECLIEYVFDVPLLLDGMLVRSLTNQIEIFLVYPKRITGSISPPCRDYVCMLTVNV